ncbi:hypothetical protein EF910_04555 [Streptomyces sp. WAC07149]|uniref:hypothetical protein n=1 Tax=Streptomyces sp. WAC07149 TaxID=2487425 RepID=UPI000F7B57BE|nr:hypothetical protein [Streptomyces sp. WAC07149]RST07726.1 hypothetical protein EF910_04555 [Streptomyces sp. WAC07149]
MRAVRGQAAMAALAMCGALVLSACQNGDDTAAPDGPPGAADPPAPGAPSKITATAPILPSEVTGKPISTNELTSWLATHPDKGLPFRYHLNAAGVIDTLEEVYVK